MKDNFSDIKCIAFDLDGTILSARTGLLGDRTKNALNAAHRKGVVLLPVSGRSFSSFPGSVFDLEGISLVVTSNGAAVYDALTGERIRQFLLDSNDIRAVMRSVESYLKKSLIAYEAFVDGMPYADADFVDHPTSYGIPDIAVPYISSTRLPVPSIIDFIGEHADQLDSIDLILKDPGLYPKIEDEILGHVDDVYITSSLPYRMEISSPRSGKVPGMNCALDLLRLSPEETIAFGDGDNDAGMLAAAGIGVAMCNATRNCLDSADFVTDLTVEEEGVADFLEKNIL